MRRTTLNAILVAVTATVIGCNKVPDHVIAPDNMAELMADMRVAEAVVKVNDRDYVSPASKYALRQEVFNRHGVTKQQFDTSLMWYGHNIDLYQEVTQQSIDILEERMVHVSALARDAAMSIAGDSVDIWDAARSYTFNRFSPGEFLTFNFDADRNWEKGDFYTWRAKFIVPPASASWSITTLYDDGSIEMTTEQLSLTETNTQLLAFFMDSTRTATHISGWMRIEPNGQRPAILDSISLTRSRKGNGFKPRKGVHRSVKAKDDAK